MAKDSKQESAFSKIQTKNTWDIGSDTPLTSQYFMEIRTNAYVNTTAVGTVIELWTAVRSADDENKWGVMNYAFMNLENAERALFKSTPQIVKPGTQELQYVSFGEALAKLGEIEMMTDRPGSSYTKIDMDAEWPRGKHETIDQLFHDMTYFKTAGNIEGIAFDEVNSPFRRVRGKIMAGATFLMSDIEDAMTGFDRAVKGQIKLPKKMEDGILSDIFNTASDRKLSLDSFLATAKKMAELDKFAKQVGAAYLAIQDVIGLKDGYDKIGGFANDEERGKLKAQAESMKPRNLMAVVRFVDDMRETLEAAKSAGAHTEPFEKFAAELELYAYLLEATRNREKLERAVLSPGYNTEIVSEITSGIQRATAAFENLGGTQDEQDSLKAWVMNPKKNPMVEWLPGFLTRYYTQRAEKMAAVAARRANADRDVATIANDVKPALDNSVPGAKKTGNQPR